MVNFNLKNAENLLAAKASTQPLNDFPVDQLPLGLRDSLSGVAPEARVPALFSALPIAAAYADGVKAKYCDGSETPMALMSIIIGEQASGKGVCRRIESIWAKKMDKDDEYPRELEAWYQQNKNKRGTVDPQPCIRHIGDTISKAALMRRQLCADGHTMYMFSEELGSMKSVWKTFGDYFRKAFDQSEVGPGLHHRYQRRNPRPAQLHRLLHPEYLPEILHRRQHRGRLLFPHDARQNARYILCTPQSAPRLHRGGAGQHPKGCESAGA